jgi:hypothetical protein
MLCIDAVVKNVTVFKLPSLQTGTESLQDIGVTAVMNQIILTERTAILA